MKAVVLNGSPNMDKGNTSLIANPFIQELQRSGVDVDFFYSYKMKANSCSGCFSCLLGKEDKCVYEDDLRSFLIKYCESDLRIFVFPVYAHSVPATMKNILDRMFVLFDKRVVIKNNRTAHSLKTFLKPGKTVLISSCSRWEKENFNIVLKFFQAIATDLDEIIVGKLFRPHAFCLKQEQRKGSRKVEDVIDAAKKAARELKESGWISPETEAVVSRELLSRDDFVDFLNDHYGFYN